MFDHPDSALHILEKMEKPSSRTDKENHALWCLLTSQAKVKQLMKISSDSLVRIAYDYYKPTENTRRKAMSALYMGDINYELGNIEDAMQYYLEGKTEVEKTDDYKTGYLIMFSLGKLYLFRNFADYALEACTAAYDYAVKDSNKRYQMTALRYLARSYCLTNELTKAIDAYNQIWNPDRPIDYQIINDSGDVLIKGSVSKENSAQITISVSDLPDNGIYTIILTSPDPNDWVYSKFKK